jgi:hypothetical protein
MPDYLKRGRWLHGVARRIDDETLAALLGHCAERMIEKARSDDHPSAFRHLRPEMG